MKLNYSLLLGILLPLLATSCIKEEALNAEADIEFVRFDSKDCDFLLEISDTIVEVGTDEASQRIEIRRNPIGDIQHVTPYFELTPGATITHIASGKNGNGLPLDFTEPQHYRVTSQDGAWSKEYTLAFNYPHAFTSFDFEHFEMVSNNRYIHYFEENNGLQYNIWATGNPGYAMCGWDTYPTQKYVSGQQGNGVRLRTESTHEFGALMKMPIAAGNLFFGSFDAKNATADALAATQFGIPFNKKPLRFTGYYMFQRGAQMTNASGSVVEGVQDYPDFYVVMYENQVVDANGQRRSITLDGSNILTHENIVGMARVKGDDIINMTDEQIRRGEWQYFDIPFELKPGKSIDDDMLKNYRYNAAIVFSSSIDGAYFIGAVGSTLYIDTVKLICEE